MGALFGSQDNSGNRSRPGAGSDPYRRGGHYGYGDTGDGDMGRGGTALGALGFGGGRGDQPNARGLVAERFK